MSAPIVFFDIAGQDSEAQRRFYNSVFDWEIGEDGRFTADVAAPIEATLRTDPADKYLYLGVEDVSATLAEIEKHGGTVDTPRFEVPGVVVLGLFSDPCGNKLGLVEMDGDKPKIP